MALVEVGALKPGEDSGQTIAEHRMVQKVQVLSSANLVWALGIIDRRVAVKFTTMTVRNRNCILIQSGFGRRGGGGGFSEHGDISR